MTTPSPELFQTMAQHVRDYAIFLLDPEGRVMSWNAGAELIKGYAPEEIIGRHFSIFYSVEDITRKWPDYELNAALREGRFEDEGWRVKKDGSRFWAGVTLTALRDERGNLVAYSKITRDLTQRKLEQEALREGEERFRLLVEGVQDYAIYMLSPDGIITSWNEGARRINGYEAAEVIGKHFSKFYLSEDIVAARPWSELATAREHGRTEDEAWRLRKDGSRFWAKVVVTALHDSIGRLRGFAKVTQDLSQRRHAEALEEASTRLNDFIAVLAHELRNPLAPIRNAAMLLGRVKPDSTDHESIQKIIERQSGQLIRIVDDLLDISRINRGSLSIQAENVGLTEVVGRAVEAARPLIDQEQHQLSVELPRTPVFVKGDEVRLTQALTNLLNNAARYTERGGRIALTLTTAEDGEHQFALIRVRDTGRGIEPHLLDAIFGMFVQGRDMIARAGGGLGVGLALARNIVELHHGHLGVRSEGAGKGSEFTIRLPILIGKHHSSASLRPVPVTSDARRVLVVDDNIDAAMVLTTLLKQHGHEVHTVYGGEDALAAAEGFRPDVILLDIGMPGLNGYEVARRLRARNRTPRPLIVALTGWGKPDDEMRSREAGIDLHVVKPVEEHQLMELMKGTAQTT